MPKLMRRFIGGWIRKISIRIGIEIERQKQIIAKTTLPDFANTSNNLKIDLPRRILNPERMVMGDDIWLGPDSLLIAHTHYPTVSMQGPDNREPIQTFDSVIRIGHRVTSTAGLQIAACTSVTIEDDVLFASNIHINDSMHGHDNIRTPFKYQQLSQAAPIHIKKGSWIGQNVVILPGVTVGAFSIVGANSVVTADLPDGSIAVGNPAKVIRRWNRAADRWDKSS
jgi:acetyltransferase-like isoleucine patch superfamily enzyme